MSENKLKNAAALIYLALGLGIPSMILTEKYDPTVSLSAQNLAIALATLGLMAGLAYQVGRGKKWATWTYTVFFVFGIFSIGTVANAFEKNLLLGMIGASQLGLQAFALYLMHETKLKSVLGLSGPHENTVKPPAKSNETVIKTPGETTPKQQHSVNPNTLNDLNKLHELLKSEAITQQEFEQQKKQILGRAS